MHAVFFFSGPLGGKFPPLSFEFAPQTITIFFIFIFTFSLPTKAIYTPKTTSLENTLHACSVEFIVGVDALASYYKSFTN